MSNKYQISYKMFNPLYIRIRAGQYRYYVCHYCVPANNVKYGKQFAMKSEYFHKNNIFVFNNKNGVALLLFKIMSNCLVVRRPPTLFKHYCSAVNTAY